MRELYYLEATRLQMIFCQVQKYRFLIFALLWIMVVAGILAPQDSFAAEDTDDAALGNTAFQTFYDFVYNAATGNLGRGIALTGGIIGLGFGAASGRALPAVVGIVLAMFGALGPTIIGALFDSAII